MSITRDHLYEQVWARPMLAVAKVYEVSANCLARVCASLSVPWPPAEDIDAVRHRLRARPHLTSSYRASVIVL